MEYINYIQKFRELRRLRNRPENTYIIPADLNIFLHKIRDEQKVEYGWSFTISTSRILEISSTFVGTDHQVDLQGQSSEGKILGHTHPDLIEYGSLMYHPPSQEDYFTMISEIIEHGCPCAIVVDKSGIWVYNVKKSLLDMILNENTIEGYVELSNDMRGVLGNAGIAYTQPPLEMTKIQQQFGLIPKILQPITRKKYISIVGNIWNVGDKTDTSKDLDNEDEIEDHKDEEKNDDLEPVYEELLAAKLKLDEKLRKEALKPGYTVQYYASTDTEIYFTI